MQMITEITNKEEKSQIARKILEALKECADEIDKLKE